MEIDTHMDDGMGICLSKEEELSLKANIQRFYKIRKKIHQAIKSTGDISNERHTEAFSNSLRPNTSTPCFSGSKCQTVPQ